MTESGEIETGEIRAMRRWITPGRLGAARTTFLARVGGVVLTLFVASILTFLLLPLAPGDPAQTILQIRDRPPTPEAVAVLREQLGLDRPLVQQYWDWLTAAVQGDFSQSYRTNQDVSSLIAQRIGPTLLLGGVALVFALGIAIISALISAAWPGRWPDGILRVIALLGIGVPSFVLGLLLLRYVVLGLGWGSIISDGTIKTVWMPAFTLAFVIAAVWSRVLRALLLEAQAATYNQVSRARGATRLRILLMHALPNAFVPFLSFVGVGIGAIIGGSAIVEIVFSWPGLGQFVVDAVRVRDLPVIQAVVLLSTVSYVLAGFLTDSLARLLDPRLRISNRRATR